MKAAALARAVADGQHEGVLLQRLAVGLNRHGGGVVVAQDGLDDRPQVHAEALQACNPVGVDRDRGVETDAEGIVPEF